METHEAVELLSSAVRGRTGTWADIGAGTGTFTRALVELLGVDTRVYAIDRDKRALEELAQWSSRHAPNVVTITADFMRPFELPGAPAAGLDGILVANALHFVKDVEPVLSRLASMLRPGGRAVFVEYDRRGKSRWVPHPISRARLPALVRAAGLSEPTVTATMPSAYQGMLYVAYADRE